jgi:hypothetical protein
MSVELFLCTIVYCIGVQNKGFLLFCKSSVSNINQLIELNKPFFFLSLEIELNLIRLCDREIPVQIKYTKEG